MQIDRKLYNPEIHDKYKALSVKQPYADYMTRAVYRDESGEYHAEKSIEVRSRPTKFRGELLICSSAQPADLPGHLPAVTCGLVELYDCKPVEEFTEQDWINTCIPEEKRPKTGFGWLLRNPRRVIEMPIKGQLGIYDLVVPKGDITEYPRMVALGSDFKKIIKDAK